MSTDRPKSFETLVRVRPSGAAASDVYDGSAAEERCECGAAVTFAGTTGYRAYACETKKWADGLLSRSVECLEKQLAAATADRDREHKAALEAESRRFAMMVVRDEMAERAEKAERERDRLVASVDDLLGLMIDNDSMHQPEYRDTRCFTHEEFEPLRAARKAVRR